MIDLKKYGFDRITDCDDYVIYKLKDTPLHVYYNGERYSFYSIIDNARIDNVYMVKLHSEEDLVFILNNVRDIESCVKESTLT